MLAVEARRLKAMRREDHLPAAPRASLVFRGAEQSAADAGMASCLVHPEKPDFGDTAPGMTAQARIDGAISVSKKDVQAACVPNRGRREIELVDVPFQYLQVFR